MIEKIVIKEKTKVPPGIKYINKLPSFRNGKEFAFKPGINIIVRKNGSGKTTLMRIIESYLLVDKEQCSAGAYNNNINRLHAGTASKLLDGIDVYADYQKNTFRLCHAGEKRDDDVMADFNSFGMYFTQLHSSTGEGVTISIQKMLNNIFGGKAKLSFDYAKMGENYPEYAKYIQQHTVTDHNEWTLLMDEPDRNLDIENAKDILRMLSYRKEQTQLIAVVHNPLLICALSKDPGVHFIEMTRGYVNKVKKTVKEFAL